MTTDWWEQEVTMTRAQLQAERDAARQVGEHNTTIREHWLLYTRSRAILAAYGDRTVPQ